MVDGDREHLKVITARLTLRPLVNSDAEPTAALVTEDVSRNLATWPCPLTREQALEKIQQSQQALARRESIDLAIVRTADDELLGWVGLGAQGKGAARLGYWIGAQHRGLGLMKEALRAFLPNAIAYLSPSIVRAHVLPTNAPSIAILASLGFSEEPAERIFMPVRDRYELCRLFTLRLS